MPQLRWCKRGRAVASPGGAAAEGVGSSEVAHAKGGRQSIREVRLDATALWLPSAILVLVTVPVGRKGERILSG